MHVESILIQTVKPERGHEQTGKPRMWNRFCPRLSFKKVRAMGRKKRKKAEGLS